MGCVTIGKITSLTCLQNFNQSLDINYKLAMLKRLYNKELTQQFARAQIRIHRTSRSKPTDREAYILKNSEKMCPLSKLSNEKSITWQYLRRWLHHKNFCIEMVQKENLRLNVENKKLRQLLSDVRVLLASSGIEEDVEEDE